MKKLSLFSCFIVFVLATSAYGGALDGSWVKHVLGAQQSPIYLDVKDMDGDGRLDVATTTDMHPNEFDSEVAWFRNNGTATDWEKFIISSSAAEDNPITNANGIAIADIDGDGHDDVVVGAGMAIDALGSVYWFKAPDEPSGAWQRFDLEVNVPNSYFKMYTLDITGDGAPDIIAGGTQEGAAVFLNPGSPEQPGAMWEKIFFPQDTHKAGSSLYLDDINGDGKTDILNTYTGKETGDPGNVSWLNVISDNGSVAFERTMIDPEEIRPFDINTMDVNGDGKKDVLVSAFKQSKIFWYEAPAEDNGTWTQHLVSDTFDGTDIYTGDLDGDGLQELVAAGLRQSKVSWFKYDRTEQTWTEHLIAITLLPGDVSLNDLDGDGDLDVVLAGLGANQVIWYENKLNENQNCVLTFMLGKDSPRLAPLRDFRDSIVVAMPGGNLLVDAYYYISPGLITCLQFFLTHVW